MPDPALRLLDEPALCLWILRRLGAPQILVELTQEQLDDCVEAAKRWFAAKKGIVRRAVLQIQAGQSEYVLPEEVAAVTHVAPTESALDLSLTVAPGFFLPDQQIPYHALAAPQSAGLYSSFTQSLQYIATAKRILGIDFDFAFDDVTHVLRVFPNPKTSGPATYTYNARNFALTALRERDHDLVKRYALATAKEIVGRVRSKRQALGAQGAVTLDGESLVKESQEDIEKLGEEILLQSDPLSFLTG